MLESELNHRLRKVKNYLGTFAIDELNEIKVTSFPTFVGINLDKRRDTGSHWIALAIYMKDLFICDSLGGILPTNEFPLLLINFLNLLLSTRRLHMTKQLQFKDSDLCGEYCILFVREMSNHHNFNSFLSVFTCNTLQNDTLVKFLNKRE